MYQRAKCGRECTRQDQVEGPVDWNHPDSVVQYLFSDECKRVDPFREKYYEHYASQIAAPPTPTSHSVADVPLDHPAIAGSYFDP